MASHSWILETLFDISTYAEKNNLSKTSEDINTLIVKLSLGRELPKYPKLAGKNVHYLSGDRH